MAVARARHEVGDEIVGALQQWVGQPFEIFAREGVRAPGLFRIDRVIGGMDFHLLGNPLLAL